MDDIRKFLELMLQQRQRSDGIIYDGVPVGECRVMIQKSLESPKVKLILEKMERSGCSIDPKKFIRPVQCHRRASGGYLQGYGITICSNYLRFQDEVTQAVTHELIHAYDECRVKNINWRDCYHRACAEIRASHLSGDCHYVREYLRGNLKEFRGHEQECVRRRATKSVSASPRCNDYLTKLALDAVWDICYNDTKPFDRAP